MLNNQTLMAVPLFVFMGIMLEKSKIAENLLDAMSLIFGRFHAGMGISVILVGMLLAASTGIVGATVVTMGLMSLPTGLSASICYWGYCRHRYVGTNYSPFYCIGIVGGCIVYRLPTGAAENGYFLT